MYGYMAVGAHRTSNMLPKANTAKTGGDWASRRQQVYQEMGTVRSMHCQGEVVFHFYFWCNTRLVPKGKVYAPPEDPIVCVRSCPPPSSGRGALLAAKKASSESL